MKKTNHVTFLVAVVFLALVMMPASVQAIHKDKLKAEIKEELKEELIQERGALADILLAHSP